MPILSSAIGKHPSCVVDLFEVRIVPVVRLVLTIGQGAPIGVFALLECAEVARGGGGIADLVPGIQLDCLGNSFLDGAIEYHVTTWEDLEVP